MKIAFIGGCGEVGGFTTLTNELVSRLSNNSDLSFVVYCENKGDVVSRTDKNGIRIVFVPRKSKMDLIYNRVRSVNDAIYNERVDIIYLLGYVSSCFINWQSLKKHKVKLVLNPDGLEWMRSKYNFVIKKFLSLSERVGISFADSIIVDSQQMGMYIKQKYGKDFVFIPYGCDFEVNFDNLELKRFGVEEKSYYIVVGRCVPENNLLEIVKGFSSTNINKKLLIITTLSQDEYSELLKKQCEKDSRIILFGPIYEKKLLYQLRLRAFGYIHGHSVGGTNPSLVEAMGCGNIVIAHKNRFNIEVLGDELGFFFSSPEELTKILEMLEKENNEDIETRRRLIKERAFKLYNWQQISNSYLEFFRKLGDS